MKNANIARVLKYYRLLNNLTVQQVATILEERNLPVSIKTIYGWESGLSQPDADMLLRLCEIYNINNILNTFGYTKEKEESVSLTRFEQQLILRYRQSESMQPAVKKLLDLDS